MNDVKKDTNGIIIYLINNLGINVEGKKKIMKLMFLTEHYDLSNDKLTKKGYLGNNFYIYNYGVFSQSVMSSYTTLISGGYIKDGFPLKTGHTVKLRDDLRDRVDKILEKFGDHSGYKLEVETLEMMNIKPSEKQKYFGRDVDVLIEQP